MKAVIYARVSTDMQEAGNQVPILESWAAQLRVGFYGESQEPLEVVKVYQEKESAFKDGHQKELSRLLVDAAHARFKIVLVWALDRLTREGVQAQFYIMSKLSRFGVSVWSYQETWTLTPTKAEYDLLLSIAAYISQGESKRRSERTKAGIERKRKESGKWGRPKGSKDKTRRKKRQLANG